MRFSDAEDAICAFLRTSGGSIAGNQLGALYNSHDGLRDCIGQFGGAKRFCERSKRLEFVGDTGSGQIRVDTQIDELEQELEDTHAQLREACEAAERAAAERDAVAATLAKEVETARRALAAAIEAEAKAAGLGIGAQVLVCLGGKYVNMRVVGYRGSKVEVEAADTHKTYILQGETIAEVAKTQSQRREQQAKDSGIVAWECHVNGSWIPFSDTLTQTIEVAYSSGAVASGVTVAGVFKRAEHSYAINWQRMVQINEKTAVERPIRRTKRPGVRSTSSSESTLPVSPRTRAEPITFMNITIQKYTLKPTGARVSGVFEEYHLGIAYKQVHQMLHVSAHVAPRISKVEYFENPFLEERFDATKQQMNTADEQCTNASPPPPATASVQKCISEAPLTDACAQGFSMAHRRNRPLRTSCARAFLLAELTLRVSPARLSG